MNKINSLLSDSHLDLNTLICRLDPKIYDKDLDDGFDWKYAISCLSNIKSALIESSVLILLKLPEEQRSEFYSNLLSFDVLTQKDIDCYLMFHSLQYDMLNSLDIDQIKSDAKCFVDSLFDDLGLSHENR